MSEPVDWQADGTPRSLRFDDIYRSATGGLEQALQVFLHGCGLPQAWAGQAQWRILETGFGLGMNFLAAWQAWKGDSHRPRLLHFVSVEAWPVSAADIVRSAAAYPELVPLAADLASRWSGLTPGMHRLSFEQGHVLLTLCIGDVRDMLREHAFSADSVFLDGFDPQVNPRMWELHTLKAVSRCCRRGTGVATWTAAGQLRRDLAQCGFVVDKIEGLPPKRHSLKGAFAPAWEPKKRWTNPATVPGECVVVGAGLAGSAAAASLARRGWRVLVLDSAAAPAAGASGLPAGLLAPNISPDDNLLSRLSRSGVRETLQQARDLLTEGDDWQASGVLELRAGQAAGHWHETAGWIKPAALVRAWLAQPNVTWRGHARVARLVRLDDGWQLLDDSGEELARARLVVVAAACASAPLLDGRVRLQPVRGQVSWGWRNTDTPMPAFPVNGNGHFLPCVPLEGGNAWFIGSTFSRGDSGLDVREEDHRANYDRLKALLPVVASHLHADFAGGSVQAWTGVRCASDDRRPLLGAVGPDLWVSTAMGSRGLTFAALCAELLAGQLHGEPLALARRMAQALGVDRQLKHAPP